MKIRAIYKIPALLACLLLISGLACSDDDEKTVDMGTKDVGQQDTGGSDGTTGDLAVADAATPDTGTPDTGTPDKMLPDAPPTSTYWKIEQANVPNKLYSVLGSSKTVVYAAGAGGLIMKYNSTTGTWTSMTNPDTGKSALNSLLYQGTQLYAFGEQMYLKLSGTTWAKGYTSTTSYYYNFQDAWGKTGGYIYGCGEMSSGTYYYMSYKSSTSSGYFSGISFSSSTALKNYLYGIWGDSSSSFVVAVGASGAILNCTSTTCSSATYWKAMTSGTTNNLMDVHGFSSKDVWAAGLGGTVVSYDGTAWKKHAVGTSSYFYGIWGTSKSNIYAVGHAIFKPGESIYHYNGTKWTKLETPGAANCNAVWGSDADNVWVVCNSKILRLIKKP